MFSTLLSYKFFEFGLFVHFIMQYAR